MLLLPPKLVGGRWGLACLSVCPSFFSTALPCYSSCSKEQFPVHDDLIHRAVLPSANYTAKQAPAGDAAAAAKRPRLLHGVLMVKNDGSMAIRSAKDACDELGVEEHKAREGGLPNFIHFCAISIKTRASILSENSLTAVRFNCWMP